MSKNKVAAKAMTVADFLALPEVAHARPEIVAAADALDRAVRWVHTSEIYEISPLLKGGEVLLTTGLGLIGVSPESRRAYIADLARVGVAALVLELGRTFHEAPVEMLDEAHNRGLPLILLRTIVPFIDVTEAAHSILISAELGSLRLAAGVTERLLGALAAEVGLTGLIGLISELTGSAAALSLANGELVVGAAPEEVGDDTGSISVNIFAGGDLWGHLTVHAEASDRIRTIVDVAARVLTVEVARSGTKPLNRHQAGAELLRDMVTGRYASMSEISARAMGAGLVARGGRQAIALCVRSRFGASGAGRLAVVVGEAARVVFGMALVTEHEGEVLVATTVPLRGLRELLDEFADEIESEHEASTGARILVAAGTPVSQVSELVATFPQTWETARLANRLVPSARVVIAADFALYQLLASVVGDESLEHFVADQLGELLAHDARTGAGLVMTLDAYLASGLSKTRTAETLGIRRQTLYGRLERISLLLGDVDLSDRGRRTALDLALVGWRLRVSAAAR